MAARANERWRWIWLDIKSDKWIDDSLYRSIRWALLGIFSIAEYTVWTAFDRCVPLAWATAGPTTNGPGSAV